jgi:hypothetical protein
VSEFLNFEGVTTTVECRIVDAGLLVRRAFVTVATSVGIDEPNLVSLPRVEEVE